VPALCQLDPHFAVTIHRPTRLRNCRLRSGVEFESFDADGHRE
jgi:hypothetical protein